ncbi:MAG TPA: hypothetical protein VK203_29405 [Nostocaceae cyanobacterium]|nr:hypothetical protein [Nostocaceae cyanobacterium]
MSKSWRDLCVGDRISFLEIPQVFMHEDTLQLYQRLIEESAVVEVCEIDKYGRPAIIYPYINEEGKEGEHWLALEEYDVWELVNNKIL